MQMLPVRQLLNTLLLLEVVLAVPVHTVVAAARVDFERILRLRILQCRVLSL
jgi:hypothetical protein